MTSIFILLITEFLSVFSFYRIFDDLVQVYLNDLHIPYCQRVVENRYMIDYSYFLRLCQLLSLNYAISDILMRREYPLSPGAVKING